MDPALLWAIVSGCGVVVVIAIVLAIVLTTTLHIGHHIRLYLKDSTGKKHYLLSTNRQLSLVSTGAKGTAFKVQSAVQKSGRVTLTTDSPVFLNDGTNNLDATAGSCSVTMQATWATPLAFHDVKKGSQTNVPVQYGQAYGIAPVGKGKPCEGQSLYADPSKNAFSFVQATNVKAKGNMAWYVERA